MHRQRKKDLNLKQNRVLDKRSSRGVMYENEELRLRTLAIADDVDRGHSELKKLRKENDSLKREMWSLRDECDKLESILKKAHPDLLLLRNEGEEEEEEEDFVEEGEEDSYGEEEERMLMMMDEDDVGSVIEGHQGLQGPPVTSWNGGDVLEGIREESESLFNAQQGIQDELEEEGLPNPGDLFLEEGEGFSGSLESPPVIHITPASASPVSPLRSSSKDGGGEVTKEEEVVGAGGIFCEEIILDGAIQDGGCVALLPKLYQVTSEIHIDPPSPPPPTGLPPQSPASSKSNFVSRSTGNGTKKEKDPQEMTTRHSLSEVEGPSKSLWRRDSLKGTGGFLGGCGSSSAGAHPLGGSVGFVLPPCPSCCSNVLHSFTYNSEPSLPSPQNSFVGFEPFCAPWASPWVSSCSDRDNLAVGYLSTSPSNSTRHEEDLNERVLNLNLKPQEIIDELERQFDPTLEKVRGLRILLPSRVFVSLKDASTLKALVNNFGVGGTAEFWVRNVYKVVFVDASDRHVVVTLSGVPPDTSDLAVISQLNQFGQVVGPVERRKYKGVDIAERLVEMVVDDSSLPPSLSVGGCQVSVTKSTRSCENVEMSGNVSTRREGVVVSSSINVIPSRVNRVSGEEGGKDPGILCKDTGTLCNKDPGIPSSHRAVKTANSLCHQEGNLLQSKLSGGDALIPTSKDLSTSTSKSTSLLKPHKPVTRSTSSNPRLETGPNMKPPSPILTKRLASVCVENLAPEAHPSKLVFATGQQQQSSSSSSAPSLIPPKKPLSRLLRSSPGSLVPPTMTGKTVSVLVGSSETPETPQPPGNVAGNAQQPTTSGGLRAAFYRTFSHDNSRRPSTTSQTEHNNNNNNPAGGLRVEKSWGHEGALYGPRRRSSGGGGGRLPHPNLMQMNSSSSSGGGGGRDRGRGGRGFGSLQSAGPKEPLPWCGCWGNGCV